MNAGEKFRGNLKRISPVVSSLVGPSRQTNCGSVQRRFNGSQIMMRRRDWRRVGNHEKKGGEEREKDSAQAASARGGLHPHPPVTMYTR